LQPKGINQKAVLNKLRNFQKQEKSYRNGKILCSMCTKPHPIAKKAYQMFFESNLGDNGLFPASKQLEQEVVGELANLLHGESTTGFLVSGGTEANLLALAAAKNKANVSHPEIVLPQSAHFSFSKICNLLNLKPVYAGLDKSYRVDPFEVKQQINKNTVAIVGTAGTAELGAVDPIEGLSEIASDKSVFLHVDAAFGGLLIPFLDKKPAFDFALGGVQAVTVDPHKMGMAAIPTGGILFKEPGLIKHLQTQTPYLTNSVQYTFTGTRPGASAASAWAVFKTLGYEGFKKIVGASMKNTNLLAQKLKKAGFGLMVEPTLNLVAFKSRNSRTLADKLWKAGWFVSYIPRYDCIRVVVMPHVKRRHILAFVEDLGRIEKL
jgi:tyrosine decarboxylase/aspartate 1-decarboxylase